MPRVERDNAHADPWAPDCVRHGVMEWVPYPPEAGMYDPSGEYICKTCMKNLMGVHYDLDEIERVDPTG